MKSAARKTLLIVVLTLSLLAQQSVAQKAVQAEPVPPRLLADLKSTDGAKRRDAANELGALRARDAVPALVNLLQDKDVPVREAAAFALGQITDPRAVAALTKATADKDSEVRASVAFALGMIGDRKSGDTLSKLLDDGSALVRASAAAAMGVMQDTAGVDELVSLLDDPSYDVRFDAAWALGQMNEADAIDHLQVAMVTVDGMAIDATAKEEFRLQAQLSIERIRANDGGYTPTRPRKTTDGVVGLNQYESRSNPAGIRQSVKAMPTEHVRAARLGGTVRVKVLVAADGRPARAYVLKRAGHGLDQRAVQAVLQYKFEPAMLGGLPQTGWVFLDLKF